MAAPVNVSATIVVDVDVGVEEPVRRSSSSSPATASTSTLLPMALLRDRGGGKGVRGDDRGWEVELGEEEEEAVEVTEADVTAVT